MATYHGKSGTMTFNSSTVAQLRSWQFDSALDIHDDTAMQENWRGRVGGLAAWQASAEVIFEKLTGQSEMVDDLLAATPTLTGATCVFTMATGKTITGVGIVTRISITARVDDIITAQVELMGDGAPTFAWA